MTKKEVEKETKKLIDKFNNLLKESAGLSKEEEKINKDKRKRISQRIIKLNNYWR